MRVALGRCFICIRSQKTNFPAMAAAPSRLAKRKGADLTTRSLQILLGTESASVTFAIREACR
jgi:hypothetical protein